MRLCEHADVYVLYDEKAFLNCPLCSLHRKCDDLEDEIKELKQTTKMGEEEGR
jgi:hypothetical protein